MDSLWLSLVSELKKDLPAQQYDTWIKPLRAERHGNRLRVLAPNHHVLRWIRANLLAKLESRAEREAGGGLQVDLVLDDKPLADTEIVVPEPIPVVPEKPSREEHRLNPSFTFTNFVNGKANQIARASRDGASRRQDLPSTRDQSPCVARGRVFPCPCLAAMPGML